MKTITQQKRLNSIIGNYIAPTMKELGFKRKARWFGKEKEQYTKSMNIASSRWNTREEAIFTLELYVYEKHISGRTKRVEDVRVGRLKTGRDKWYELTKEVDADQLGQQIQEDIRTYAVPLFNRFG